MTWLTMGVQLLNLAALVAVAVWAKQAGDAAKRAQFYADRSRAHAPETAP